MPTIKDYIEAIKSPQDNLNRLKRFRPFLQYDGSMDFWFNEESIVFHMIDSLQDNYEFGLECCLKQEYFEKQKHTILSAPDKDICLYEAELNVSQGPNKRSLYPVILHRKYVKKQKSNEYVFTREEEPFEISEDGKTLLYWKMPSGIIGTGFSGAYIPEGIEIIADGAFAGCQNLIQVSFPKSLKKIGRGAFLGSCGFELYLNSEHIEEIGDYAFEGCVLNIRYGIENLLKISGKIGAQAFKNAIIRYHDEYKPCRVKNGRVWSLNILPYNFQEEINNNNPFPNDNSIWNETVVDKDGVVYDKTNRYVLRCNNKGLIKYTIKETAIGVFPDAFAGLEKLNEIDLSCVKYIGEGAFSYCNNLKFIKFGPYVEYLGPRAFAGTGLNEIQIPPLIRNIPEELFRNCKSLTSVMIPDNVVSIERLAFGNCSSLQKINMPKCLIKIGELAFCNCIIGEIKLPKSLLHMDYSPFSGCRKTRILSDSPLFYANEQFLLGYQKTRLISYLADETNIVIPGTVKVILGYSLLNKNRTAKIFLPNSVEYIGHWAFSSTKAKQINFPKSVTYVKSSFDYGTCIESYIIEENSVKLLEGKSQSNTPILKYNKKNELI